MKLFALVAATTCMALSAQTPPPCINDSGKPCVCPPGSPCIVLFTDAPGGFPFQSTKTATAGARLSPSIIWTPPSVSGQSGTLACSSVPGPIGNPGINGANGQPGLQGVPGIEGAAGQQGIPGEPGPQGNSIQGPMGSVGPTGQQGVQGITGPAGSAGLPGAAGVQGQPGIAGINGINGVNGDTGAAGSIGLTGAAGVAGVPGTAGAAGQIGATGAVGARGAVGAAGTMGATGAVGPPGQGIDASGNLAVNNLTVAGSLSITGPNPTGIHLSNGAGGDTVLSSPIPGTLQINGVPIPMGASPAASPTASGSFTVSPDGTEVAFWCSPTLQSIPNWSNATCLGPQSLIIPTGAGHAGVGGIYFGVSVPGLLQ